MKTIGAMLLALLLHAVPAQAALVAADSALGPATVIRDTEAGLDWLKLPLAADMSINQVYAAMAPGGKLEGFRYPTYEELTCVLLERHAGLGCRFHWVSFDTARTQAFFDLFGGKPAGRSFHTVDPPGRDPQSRFGFGARFYFYEAPSPRVEFDTQQIPLNEERLNQPATHWLVRPSPAAR